MTRSCASDSGEPRPTTAEGPRRQHLWRALGQGLFDLCFPPVCLGCDAALPPGQRFLFCPACAAAIDYLAPPFCRCCGRAFLKAAGKGHLCGTCLTRRRHFASARAVAHYREPLTNAIYGFKYGGATAGLHTFAAMLHRHPLSRQLPAADRIVPVPLHPERLKERGFNQALLLARAFFPEARRRIAPALLERRTATPPQTGLAGSVRRRNLKNAFAVTDPTAVRGRTILLVDDVFTTGSTIDECARTLRRAGAEAVHALTLARVVEDD